MLRKLLHANVRSLKSTVAAGIAKLIPSTCLLCGLENEHIICCACSAQFFSGNPKRCISCALPILKHDTHCGACLKKPPAFDHTTVACDYVAPLDQLILALKFGHRLAIAPALAELLANAVHDIPELLIAVPLSRERLAQRGFNQALEIAKPLAHKLQRPIYPRLLLRVRDTEAQTLLHPDQRHENIRYAFSPNDGYADKIRGRHIGVVDDVMTTGSTLQEIAACLKRHGAKRVSNIVFARTPPH
ncbi:ComF family protein [Solimicrobium silvestre]|uniref:Putative amidophosphoribosyltransferase n=1 Tax=Solimicrobium silvestre TaxID=2099400 RepID=A0A2S9H141_9BURK|nr:ComF family protein [Solimicrobium silvestre]PRC93704.1 putative amidophosphoribosyltransferase [Solimicrobium silvestre]